MCVLLNDLQLSLSFADPLLTRSTGFHPWRQAADGPQFSTPRSPVQRQNTRYEDTSDTHTHTHTHNTRSVHSMSPVYHSKQNSLPLTAKRSATNKLARVTHNPAGFRLTSWLRVMHLLAPWSQHSSVNTQQQHIQYVYMWVCECMHMSPQVSVG